MRKSSMIAGFIFTVFSVFVLITSLSMDYYSSIGPGPGFFTFWLSLILGLLSVGWIIQEFRKKPRKESGEKTAFPRGKSLARELEILGAMVFMACFMGLIGFQISMFLFLSFLLIVLGKVNKVTSLVISLVGSVGLFYIFTGWLDVQLPLSSMAFLSAIGF
jgi:putative tricarboxylic transport membrane protein